MLEMKTKRKTRKWKADFYRESE